MKLSQIVSGDFSSTIRQRGNSYYRAGKVKIVEGNDEVVRAVVRGSGAYKVVLTREEDIIEASCTCPYADNYGDLCKHVWAVILSCDNSGYLNAGEMNRDLSVVLAGLEDDEDDEEYDDEDDDEEYDDEDDRESYLTAVKRRWAKAVSVTSAREFIAKAKAQKQSLPKQEVVKKPSPPEWKKLVGNLSGNAARAVQSKTLDWPPTRELLYLIDVPATMQSSGLVVDLMVHHRKKDGNWTKLTAARFSPGQLHQLPDETDRQVLTILLGAKESYSGGYYSADDYSHATFPRYQLSTSLQRMLLPLMCRTGRCQLRQFEGQEDCPAISWDEGAPYQFGLEVARDEKNKQYTITGLIRRETENGMETLPASDTLMVTESGLLFTASSVARLDHGNAFQWLALLRKKGQIVVPFSQGSDFLETALRQPEVPRLMLPDELQFAETTLVPQPCVKLVKSQNFGWSEKIHAEVSFKYDSTVIDRDDKVQGAYLPERRLFIRRNHAIESAAVGELKELGFQSQTYYYSPKPVLEISSSKVPRVVRQLIASGWLVEAEGKLYRNPGNFNIAVNSGIDWFEMHGTVDYGGATASLPQLLSALRRGENTVKLGDGTFGLLPEEWLKKYAVIAGLGEAKEDHIRFKKSQAGFLDALLAVQPEVKFDAAFARVRDELQSFSGIRPQQEPAGFTGELRPYQRDALGWFEFLRQFGFGGCLADDMGLGKTLMTLALLEARRELRAQNPAAKNGKPQPSSAPSLAVLPKSLIFNWKQEALRFTPALRVLDHTGQTRKKDTITHFDDYDLILTTYGTLRNDAALFKDVTFDYVILDEAQAIKNATTASAKAARLLNGHHKLALSGTPIENHLGELWSLIDFLNPGLLGASSAFGAGAGRNPDEETRKMLSQALRPFILRRTKEQVAKDLPEKLEQTIYCELESAQQKQYDELRDHYRATLLGKVDDIGLNKSKMHILEALLRLRQAACHPGLLDKKKASETAAKLDVLLPQLQEVLDEGHKALVFSQFTSFLAILRQHLDKSGTHYEYLDGKTKDRQAIVERFQNDPDSKLFLISLKAGGLGLNLTAAEYVFLLDPWWNPAVEAQAVDRAHRIGQQRNVFAYRLIAKGTVEEKVLELQNTKRDLADAIINADNSLIRSLKREDLELLLS
jgi:superfamily II DNA or RNA helicase/uncharacterized Zn finger protein